MPALKLIVESSIEAARQSIDLDFSMRSSINMPMQIASSRLNNENPSVMSQHKKLSQDFEELYMDTSSKFSD